MRACRLLLHHGLFPTTPVRQYHLAHPTDFAHRRQPFGLFQTTFRYSSLPQVPLRHCLQTICSRRLSTFAYRTRATTCTRLRHVLSLAHQKHRLSDPSQTSRSRSPPCLPCSHFLAESPAWAHHLHRAEVLRRTIHKRPTCLPSSRSQRLGRTPSDRDTALSLPAMSSP